MDEKVDRNESDSSGHRHMEHFTAQEKDRQISHDEDYLPIEPAMQKRLNRKFDLHITPWLFGFWLLAFLDRANVGNAKIDGLPMDLGLKGNQFNVALAIFYVPYIVIDIPANLVVKKVKAGNYLPILLTSWGLVTTFQGFIKDYAGFLAARFFLGMCEGGLLGGMVIYLAMFYERHAMLWRIGIFYCAAPLSGAFGGLLATGLAEIKAPGYNGWPFIFFVEGAITVVFGVISWFFLPHTPADAKFLTEEEKDAAVKRVAIDSQSGARGGNVNEEKFDWHWVKMALTDVNCQMLSWIYFLIITPIYSYSLFLPTIIKALGFSKVVSQLLTVPPNMCAFFMVFFVCWLSDRIKQRGIFMFTGVIIAIGGYIMLISTPNIWVEYGGTFLVAVGIFPTSPVILAWLSNNMAPHYMRAAGTGYQIMIANCGAFIATFTYVQADAPRYITGHAINLGVIGAAAVLIVILIFYNKAENRRRANGHRDDRLREGNEWMLGSRHPNFRYTL